MLSWIASLSPADDELESRNAYLGALFLRKPVSARSRAASRPHKPIRGAKEA